MSPTDAVRDLGRVIITIRETKVILDSDLAALYGVETKTLNRAVKRNLDRFPESFMFSLQSQEFTNLKHQIGTSSSYGGRRKLPYVFTEHGAPMAANVLNSPRAVKMSVALIGAFVQLRQEFFFAPNLNFGASPELREAMYRFDESGDAAEKSALPVPKFHLRTISCSPRHSISRKLTQRSCTDNRVPQWSLGTRRKETRHDPH